jgi:hypothetical protein
MVQNKPASSPEAAAGLAMGSVSPTRIQMEKVEGEEEEQRKWC